MAWNIINKCAYKNCGVIFKTLNELIVHIDDKHIDFDPKVIDDFLRQKVSAVPLSYISRYVNDNEIDFIQNETIEDETCDILNTSSVNVDYEQNFQIQQTFQESAGNIGHYLVDLIEKKKWNFPKANTKAKQFSCLMPGCTKRYKHHIGMQNHMLACHNLIESLQRKEIFTCRCGKEYKTLRGLKSHAANNNHDNQTTQNDINSLLQKSTTASILTTSSSRMTVIQNKQSTNPNIAALTMQGKIYEDLCKFHLSPTNDSFRRDSNIQLMNQTAYFETKSLVSSTLLTKSLQKCGNIAANSFFHVPSISDDDFPGFQNESLDINYTC